MQALTTHTGVVLPMDRANVDTDQLMPKQFLQRVERTGFGQFLFHDWRFRDDETEDPDFELNQPAYREASILLARDNFGSGSSREHAPWGLADYGFRVLIAPSFADIFYNNSFKNGILPIILPAEVVEDLFQRVYASPGMKFAVDLEKQELVTDDGLTINFEVPAERRQNLLEGLDEIALTLCMEDKIAAYEKSTSS